MPVGIQAYRCAAYDTIIGIVFGFIFLGADCFGFCLLLGFYCCLRAISLSERKCFDSTLKVFGIQASFFVLYVFSGGISVFLFYLP